MSNETSYAFSTNLDKIKALVKARDCITYLGIPMSGKHRVLKQVISEIKEEEKTVFLSLNAFSEFDNNPELIDKLMTELTFHREKGKEVFIFDLMPLDSEICYDLYTAIAKYRMQLFSLPCFVFILRSSPFIYQDIFKDCRIMFSNIIYEDLTEEQRYKSLINQLSERFALKRIPNEIISEIREISGGIPTMIKELIKYYKECKEIDLTDTELKQTLKSIACRILDELPNRDHQILNLIKNQSDNYKSEIEHFKKEGLLNDKLIPNSIIIQEELRNYSRNFAITFLNKRIYLNGRDISENFKPRELIIMNLFSTSDLVTRLMVEKAMKIDNEKAEVSEYAIDQVISRLRKHLKQLGVNPRSIQTLKRKGYIFKEIL